MNIELLKTHLKNTIEHMTLLEKDQRLKNDSRCMVSAAKKEAYQEVLSFIEQQPTNEVSDE